MIYNSVMEMPREGVASRVIKGAKNFLERPDVEYAREVRVVGESYLARIRQITEECRQIVDGTYGHKLDEKLKKIALGKSKLLEDTPPTTAIE